MTESEDCNSLGHQALFEVIREKEEDSFSRLEGKWDTFWGQAVHLGGKGDPIYPGLWKKRKKGALMGERRLPSLVLGGGGGVNS